MIESINFDDGDITTKIYIRDTAINFKYIIHVSEEICF